jgi:hypothetical protein
VAEAQEAPDVVIGMFFINDTSTVVLFQSGASHSFTSIAYVEKQNLPIALVLVVIKCIYLQPTYLHLIQDIEDRCLLLMSSTNFIDLPFQVHRMTEKHHMDQNPCISSSRPKYGIVTENMTRGNNVTQSTSSTEPRRGWPGGHVLAHLQKMFCLRAQKRRCSRYTIPKGSARRKPSRPAKLHVWLA